MEASRMTWVPSLVTGRLVEQPGGEPLGSSLAHSTARRVDGPHELELITLTYLCCVSLTKS